jgi:WD40 repeat protein
MMDEPPKMPRRRIRGILLASAALLGLALVILWCRRGSTGLALEHTLRHNVELNAAKFSIDGTLLATTDDDGYVKLWEVPSGQLRATIQTEAGNVEDAAFSPDGTTLAAACADGTVKLWDVRTQKLHSALDHGGEAVAVAFTPDGKFVASGGEDGTVKIWDLASAAEPVTLSNQDGRIWSLAFAPDGRVLASASADYTVTLFDVAARKLLTTFDHEGEVNAVAFSPDGQSLATGSDDGFVRVWDLSQRRARLTLPAADPQTDYVLSVAFAPDGRTLAAGIGGDPSNLLENVLEAVGIGFGTAGTHYTGEARLWDSRTGKSIAAASGHTDWVWSVAFSPDGERLATASDDSTARLWLLPHHVQSRR